MRARPPTNVWRLHDPPLFARLYGQRPQAHEVDDVLHALVSRAGEAGAP